MTVPVQSSGASITKCSKGSHLMPSISLMITSGRPRQNSKPSRRIFSAKIVICSSPRPLTLNFPSPAFSYRIAMLVFISASKRSSILFEVTNLPSVPASGPSFTLKITLRVGSSICSASSGIGLLGSTILSPTSSASKPAIATMSPVPAASMSVRSSPLKPMSFEILPFICVPSALANITLWFLFIVPLKILAIPILPT